MTAQHERLSPMTRRSPRTHDIKHRAGWIVNGEYSLADVKSGREEDRESLHGLALHAGVLLIPLMDDMLLDYTPPSPPPKKQGCVGCKRNKLNGLGTRQ
jgi:hypothetical protein